MKTKLLSLLSVTLMFSGISMAQTKVWDFGNDTATWPISTGIGNDPIIVDDLGLYPIATNTNFGTVTSSNTTFDDGYTATQRFQFNGGGGVTPPDYMPVQRYLYFDVDSDCQVKIWFKTGSNGAIRKLMVTDGSSLLGSGTSNSGSNTDLVSFTANYPGAGGRIYVYGDSANNIYKMEVTGANVITSNNNGLGDFNGADSVLVYANGKNINVANVTSNATVNVYNMTGALVKTVNTTTDTNIEVLSTGLYIVNVQSAEGQKSFKVVVQ